MRKPVSLTVHKNTLRKRRSRKIRDEIVYAANGFRRDYGERVDGYALVMWTRDRAAEAYWDGGDDEIFIEERVSNIIRRTLANRDTLNMLDPEGDDDGA